MPRDANAGADALARCLADVTSRVAEDALLNYLTPQEAHELANWDAEKYRQELTQRMREHLQ
jgi:rhamnose utilization protein RhaD (predicted bifunctional aldolase and dehydrogenase)